MAWEIMTRKEGWGRERIHTQRLHRPYDIRLQELVRPEKEKATGVKGADKANECRLMTLKNKHKMLSVDPSRCKQKKTRQARRTSIPTDHPRRLSPATSSTYNSHGGSTSTPSNSSGPALPPPARWICWSAAISVSAESERMSSSSMYLMAM